MKIIKSIILFLMSIVCGLIMGICFIHLYNGNFIKSTLFIIIFIMIIFILSIVFWDGGKNEDENFTKSNKIRE